MQHSRTEPSPGRTPPPLTGEDGQRDRAVTDGAEARSSKRFSTVKSELSKHHKKDRVDDCCGGIERHVYDFEPTWMAESTWSGSARRAVLKVLRLKSVKRSLLLIVALYILLAAVWLLLDLRFICFNPRHRYSQAGSASFLAPRPHRRASAHTPSLLVPEEPGSLHKFSFAVHLDRQDVLLCDPPYAEGNSASIESIGWTCLLLSFTVLLEVLALMFAVGHRYFFGDGWLLFDFSLVLMCFVVDVLIVFIATPHLELAYREHENEYVHWYVYLLRVWSVSLVWRVVRWLRAEESPGHELLEIFDAVEMMQSTAGGMPNTEILDVQVVKNSAGERESYVSRLKTMRKQHGVAREQLLFFGTKEVPPAEVVEHVRGMDQRFSMEPRLRGAFCGAERPVYVDAGSAFVDQDTDASNRTKQLFIFQALIGKPESLDSSQTPVRREQKSLVARNPLLRLARQPTGIAPGYDCICAEGWEPEEYQPELIGVKRRDVASDLFAFPEPTGQLLLMARVTYQHRDNFEETERLMELGAKSWRHHALRLQGKEALSKEQEAALQALGAAIDSGNGTAVADATEKCEKASVPHVEVESVKHVKKCASEDAGVSLAYLLSPEFADLARRRTGKEDPTFIDMKNPFFLDETHVPIGQERVCPRDLQPGCAFVDTLQPEHRRKATHFQSWVWQYSLSTVCDCLRRWAASNGLKHDEVFLFICFFCNNQWRILYEKSSQGSDNLEVVFESRLKKIGKVVALMDSWNDSVYIKRIWTIYEQYVAAQLGIEMQFSLPTSPAATLLEELERGKDGIQFVIQAVSMVDAERAKATMPEDERKVKGMIRQSEGGFHAVNTKVRSCITAWIAGEFKAWIDRETQSVAGATDEQGVVRPDMLRALSREVSREVSRESTKHVRFSVIEG